MVANWMFVSETQKATGSEPGLGPALALPSSFSAFFRAGRAHHAVAGPHAVAVQEARPQAV